MYTVTNSETMNNNQITVSHFGANLVTSSGTEFVNTEWYPDLVEAAGITTLRFPGGSVTEERFDMTNPNATVSIASAEFAQVDLTPMDAFFMQAAESEVSVSLVIPTKFAFEQTPEEAAALSVGHDVDDLPPGSFGNRTEIRDEYIAEVVTYIEAAMAEATLNDVAIDSFEIGNEFWGSGRMTATEYGIVAGHVAIAVQEAIEGTVYEDAEVLLQLTRSTGGWSPKFDTTEYIEDVNGEAIIRTLAEYDGFIKDNGFSPNWTEFLVEGQGGTPKPQAGKIADSLLGDATPDGAEGAIDGVLFHYYRKSGFDAVDGEVSALFTELNEFVGRLGLSNKVLTQHITEWGPRAGSGVAQDSVGLRHASMMSEMFYEMVRNGVDSAQIWPLSFNNAVGPSLIDEGNERLTIGGEMFRLMNEVLVDTKTLFDFGVQGEIDVHGYEALDEKRIALFVSDRDGETETEQLDVSAFVDSSMSYFLVATELWDGGTTNGDRNVEPVITYHNGSIQSGGILDFNLPSWSNLRVELTYVTDGDDYIEGRGGDDHIIGKAGNDHLSGGEGNDRLDGGRGEDKVYGGNGSDTLSGGSQNENYSFSYDTDINGYAAQIYRLFQGLFDRDPNKLDSDTAGYNGWITNLENGMTLDTVIQHFLNSAEMQVLYGNTSNSEFVTLLFQNILGRDPADAGLNFWVGNLEGGMARSKVVGHFTQSPENKIYTADSFFEFISGDFLTGGAGNDTFVFSGDFGGDFVSDLDTSDVIDFSNVAEITSFTDLVNNHSEAINDGRAIESTLVSVDEDNFIYLSGVDLADFATDNFVF